VDEILKQLSPQFTKMYAKVGRPSIPPEHLLRAQLLQMLYSVRSERPLMEEVDYNILFRWFVGLNMDDAVWDATVFTKNRDRLLEAELAKEFLARVVAQAREGMMKPTSPRQGQRWQQNHIDQGGIPMRRKRVVLSFGRGLAPRRKPRMKGKFLRFIAWG
jgi:hypothetical protein